MRKLLENDMRTGTKGNILKFCIAALFAFVSCLYFNRRAEIYCISQNIAEISLSGQDYILYLFGGMAKLKSGMDETFEIPFIWTAVQLLACSCVCLYPVKDLNQRGTVFLLQSCSRVRWWISKCIWAVIQLLILYCCFCAGITLAMEITGGGWSGIHSEIFYKLEKVRILDTAKINFGMIFFQILYSIAISMLQMNISLSAGAVWGIMIIVSCHILSVCTVSEWFLGNISMLYRMEGIVFDGQKVFIGFIGCILLMAVSVCLGLKYFKACDIL